MAKKRKKKLTSVDSLRHQDKRKNIPTEELRDFVREDEQKPKTMLYPRDPSLDPQLVWQGKDQQDREPLEVPVVPIYIQEKIHPQAIIDDLRRRHERRPAEQQLNLFADFNGLDDFSQKVDFYHHDQNWSNRMILGDSLLVMTSLAEKEGLKGQVQMIYIDPPYGIKFASNWQVSTRRRSVTDGKATDTTRQPEQIRAFRDTWQLGIHSYLTYLRDRLVAARELLTDTGSVFVQIGDENLHLVRSLLDEAFGSENFVSSIQFAKTSSASSQLLPGVVDYILWYGKNAEQVKYRPLYREKVPGEEGATKYDSVQLPDGTRRLMTAEERSSAAKLPSGARVFTVDQLTSQKPPGSDPFTFHGHAFSPLPGYWKTGPDGLKRLAMAERVVIAGNKVRYVRFLDDFPVFALNNLWSGTGSVQSRTDPKVYVVQTATTVVERCLLMTTDPGDLVLDPTCGSGTTAYVAEQWGRRWITTDTSRVALTLARTRLMTTRFAFHLLADSPEGVKKETEITAQVPPPHACTQEIKRGFVYRRVPRLSLKYIANNEEIDGIHAAWQEKTEPARNALNKCLQQSWEEWDIPRETDDEWPTEAKKSHGEWWEMRRARQKEIDQSIARCADQELLYDQPYEDRSIVRVTGPFTVESLSPHRRMSVEQKREGTGLVEGLRIKQIGPDRFGNMIIDNLKKAGIQNRVKQERLKFDMLEPYAGEWIHATGEYTDKSDESHRVALTIGPEHGTVGPELIKEAAKEAVKGVGFDLLVVCGFAFDPHVDEEAQRYGDLEVLTCRMNPDLSMGDALLKKTGAGNLFMIFGEPDISMKRVSADDAEGADKKKGKKNLRKSAQSADEKTDNIVIEIHGVDVYDPTTGQIRSDSTDDIACWFIDTNYDGESFFVRHAYFTGAAEPYDKLKRALRAEIDESAWSALYATESQPFPPPETGKIAVKVINHYGDEVLKVYNV